MHTEDMKRAVAACTEAGIGLTAMKTQGGGQIKTNTPSELQMAGRFLSKGFTDAQAKLKAVWSNPAISSICSEMPNMTILKANVAAALDRTTLSHRDMELLSAVSIDHVKELSYYDRKAMHNLKYFTWIEQQGRTYEEIMDQGDFLSKIFQMMF